MWLTCSASLKPLPSVKESGSNMTKAPFSRASLASLTVVGPDLSKKNNAGCTSRINPFARSNTGSERRGKRRWHIGHVKRETVGFSGFMRQKLNHSWGSRFRITLDVLAVHANRLEISNQDVGSLVGAQTCNRYGLEAQKAQDCKNVTTRAPSASV